MRSQLWTYNLRLFAIVLLLAAGSGCITTPRNPAATQPSTAVDPATTQPGHWLDQPGIARASSIDFERLAAACEDVARDYLFKLDRVDYRSGVITTQPLVSAQWFEPWRQDNRTAKDVEESSLATIRRTIRFELRKLPDLSWEVTPKILVERQAIAERRITAVTQYRSVFATQRGRDRAAGSREADAGVVLPGKYWYPLRRDAEFEKVIAAAVEKRIQKG